jgi:hypothetical protein
MRSIKANPFSETASKGRVGKRKSAAATEPPRKSEALVDCWNNGNQSISVIPASRVKQLYNSKHPLLPDKSRKRSNREFQLIFPLSLDHLITLLQFNALRALAVNRSLVTGIMVTPLDCNEEEIIHVVPCPTHPELMPPALLPTILQQTVPHGDWVDLFPCPEGRDMLIRASGTFDADELWADCIGGLYEGFPDDEIEKRGIVAWSPPWDIRGWEMSEGFVRKWWWVFGGLDRGLEATNRWRVQRGEEPLRSEDYVERVSV